MVDELVAEVKAARRAESALKRHNARIRELFVQVRLAHPELGPADIEQLTGRYRDRATISRVTVPKMGDRLPRRRGRNTAGPSDVTA